MIQKSMIMVAVLGAIMGILTGGVVSLTTHAFGYYDQGGNYYTCPWNGCPDNKAAITQPTVQQTSEETCHYWSSGYSHCEPGPFFKYNQQPHLTQTAYFRDNCFWSYPVICNSNLDLSLSSASL